ncbi:MAG: ABC transporter ATP-binding protein, partial [Phyllobacterium sp.]
EQRIAAAAEILQIGQLLQRKPAELSGGQRQRVAIGRALVRDVDVFLFDEPLSNLDAKLRSELRVEIKRLHHKLANTMIYVTHDQIEALTLADRIAVMKGGLIQQLDEPLTIYNKPRNLFVASFIGSPAMNFLKGDITGKGNAPAFSAADLTLSLASYEAQKPLTPGQSVTFGFRPEHIGIADTPGPADLSCEAVVDLDEPMGADSLVWLKVAGKPISVRVDSGRRYLPGEKVFLTFNPAMASLFDTTTEDRL